MDIGIHSSWNDIFPRGINDSCSSRDDQMTSHLLDPTILDVDIRDFGRVFVDDRSILDQEAILRALQMDWNLLHGGSHLCLANVGLGLTRRGQVKAFWWLLSHRFFPKEPKMSEN